MAQTTDHGLIHEAARSDTLSSVQKMQLNLCNCKNYHPFVLVVSSVYLACGLVAVLLICNLTLKKRHSLLCA